MSYKPAAPFSAALVLLIPTYTDLYGVAKKTFPEIKDGVGFFGSFKSYGGTEGTVNGVYAIDDTAIVETWYRPDIKADCRIAVMQTGAVYDIINEPENIELRNQYLRFKVRRVRGGA